MGERDSTGHDVDAERPYLLMILGALGFLGVISLIGTTLVAPFYVPNYSSVADTISDLAAGETEIIMDVGLYGFAIGLFAMTIASAHAHLGGIGWSIGVLCLAILAALVIIVGARNEYGDGDNEGIVIHIYLVYGLGLFFLLAPITMARGIGRHGDWAKWTSYALAAIWCVSAPIFFFLPTSIDGIYERFLGGISCLFVLLLSYVFFRRGMSAHRNMA